MPKIKKRLYARENKKWKKLKIGHAKAYNIAPFAETLFLETKMIYHPIFQCPARLVSFFSQAANAFLVLMQPKGLRFLQSCVGLACIGSRKDGWHLDTKLLKRLTNSILEDDDGRSLYKFTQTPHLSFKDRAKTSTRNRITYFQFNNVKLFYLMGYPKEFLVDLLRLSIEDIEAILFDINLPYKNYYKKTSQPVEKTTHFETYEFDYSNK